MNIGDSKNEEIKQEVQLNLDTLLKHFLFNYNLIKEISKNVSSDWDKEVLYITKFPPTVGGVASQEYWRARQLALSGFKVRVITTANESESENMSINWSKKDLENINFVDENSGGLLQTFYTDPSYINGKPKDTHRHIPMDKMSQSKLVGLALNVIKHYQSSIIISGYLEPYGSAATEVGLYTGIPVYQYFAGSDIERLSQIPEIGWKFQYTLAHSTHISTTWDKFQKLLALDIPLSKLSPIPPPAYVPPEIFKQEGVKFYNKKTDEFIVGLYGKYSRSKCLEELLLAIKQLVNKGYPIKLFLLLAGDKESKAHNLIRKLELENSVILKDAIPTWEIPSFIRSCDVICLLEENFTVKAHAPITPLEIALCGSCPIFSREMYNKIRMEGFIEDVNCIIVNNPRNVQEIYSTLKRLITKTKLKYYKENLLQVGSKLLTTSSMSDYIKNIDRIGNGRKPINSLDKKERTFPENVIIALSFFPLSVSYLNDKGLVETLKWARNYNEKTDYLTAANNFSNLLVKKYTGTNLILDDIIHYESGRVKSMILAKKSNCGNLVYTLDRATSFLIEGIKGIPKLKYEPIIIELQTNIHDCYNKLHHKNITINLQEKKIYLMFTSSNYRPILIEVKKEWIDVISKMHGYSLSEDLINRLISENELQNMLTVFEEHNVLEWIIN